MSERKKFAPPAIQEFAPKLAEVTDTVLFGDIWERPGLSPRDRSLVTVTALASLYRTDQLGFHLGKALENGVTKDELIEAITHLTFYAGWPNGMSAMTQLKAIVDKADKSESG
ncbi:carboxymuconolactone decarboxylase family protein [Streptomyces coeruleorubidus]|uniref:carboxymuconolactone decarboxylase family protein n=1 Tax=Streptomyces coeruleorubidus TaxID=116188 RepID=UPI0036FE7C95